MFRLENFDPVPESLQGGFLAVGNFDGVHRGHAGLIGRLRRLADEAGAPAIALSFDPPPLQVLRPGRAAVPLTTIEQKVALLHDAGAHHVGLFQTGQWLLGLTAREFFDRVVRGQFAARGMVEGPTFGFGRDRGGDSQALEAWCSEAGLRFEVAHPANFDGQIVSSTRIRNALKDGRASEAALLLGRPYRLTGRVRHGAGRGAGLGFPTANLQEIVTLVPAHGVYAARAILESGERRLSALHIGPNATFGVESPSVEAHLLDFQGDLYGQTLHLDLLEFVRPTRKFDGINDLLEQIRLDVERTREIGKTAL
ncbi:MAG TPA: riboflavin biosynthesis protein RibF [Isosphaeraceae bacterium]|nr:riboflavin biosynthesis protein RibF [Isosphaeraceae bacterium]